MNTHVFSGLTKGPKLFIAVVLAFTTVLTAYAITTGIQNPTPVHKLAE